MINRVLIRMKTVQLLYSYLLVERPFSLESQPSSPTKEKRFSYNLYLDLIYLFTRLAKDVIGKNKTFPLKDTRFILKLSNDEKLKSLEKKYSEEAFPLTSAEQALKEAVRESLLFKNFEKNRSEGISTDDFWENVFKAIILPNPVLDKVIKGLPGYSLSGMERMKDLMDLTFKNFYATKDNVDDALKTLESSMYKARDLYMRLLALPVDLTRLRMDQLEQRRNRPYATVEDLHPNMRFVSNKIPELIDTNKDFQEYEEKNHISWLMEDRELMEILLKAILESEVYAKYKDLEKTNLQTDSDFWRDILYEVILNNKYFLEFLENKSVFWNDDLEIMMSFVFKTLKRFENPETSQNAVLPMYKDGMDGKDAKFGSELFKYVVKNKEIYKKYIQDTLARDKWDTERLAFMDVVIIMTALAEILNYPEIPLQVSINEYIEIAKSYSSVKSGQFINGLLGSILDKLKDEKIIVK